jgi:hypothetical protein
MVAQGYLQGARALGSPFSTNKLYKVNSECGKQKTGLSKSQGINNTTKD